MIDILPTSYHTNYSPSLQWSVDMHNEVIIASAAYDVPVDNYEEFDLEIDKSKLGDKLVQSNTLKGTAREFQFYSDSHLLLNLVKKKNAKADKFRVDLAWLSSEPVHNKVIVWKWLFAALASAVSMGLFIFLAIQETIKSEYSIVAGTVSLTAALIFLLIFIYQIRDEYIFTSQFGHARLFLIENKKPDQGKFDSFFSKLQQTIDKSKARLSVSERLVGELKMCRRLRDEGIIDDASYTFARTTIFKHEQYKS